MRVAKEKKRKVYIYIYILYPIVLRYSNCYNFKISKSNTKFKNLEAVWIHVHVSSPRFTFFFFFFVARVSRGLWLLFINSSYKC